MRNYSVEANYKRKDKVMIFNRQIIEIISILDDG